MGAAVCIPPSLVGNPAQHSPRVALKQCCDGRAPLGPRGVGDRRVSGSQFCSSYPFPPFKKASYHGSRPGCHWAQVRLADTKHPPGSPVQASDGVAEGAAPEVQLGPAPALGPVPALQEFAVALQPLVFDLDVVDRP